MEYPFQRKVENSVLQIIDIGLPDTIKLVWLTIN